MRKLGLWAVRPKRNTSKRHPGHKVYSYLLRGKTIDEPNQVWAADITNIPMRQGFLYLVAIIDWATRRVPSWRLSNTLTAGFCVEALSEALARFGKPGIFNTDQGAQFVSDESLLIVVLIGSFHYSTHAFSTYHRGEILLQATTPWLVLTAYRVPEMHAAPAVLLAAGAIIDWDSANGFLAWRGTLLGAANSIISPDPANIARYGLVSRGMKGQHPRTAPVVAQRARLFSHPPLQESDTKVRCEDRRFHNALNLK